MVDLWFKVDYHTAVENWLADGATMLIVARRLGIGIATLYRIVRSDERLNRSVTRGKEKYQMKLQNIRQYKRVQKQNPPAWERKHYNYRPDLIRWCGM